MFPLRSSVTIFRMHLLCNEPRCTRNEGNEILHYTIEDFKPLGDTLQDGRI